MNEITALKTSTTKVLVFSTRNQIIVFLKPLETITACFLGHAIHTRAVGLQMSALQPTTAEEIHFA